MNNQRLIYEIRSKYILRHIFDHIEDKKIELKLFSYSKYFKSRINLNYSYCYKRYLDILNFDINKFLYKAQEKYNAKDILKKEYDDFISNNNFNKEKFESILYDVMNWQNEKHLINIDSPLFKLASKTKNFHKNYVLYISQKNIDDYNLKGDYKILLQKLNNSNIKYSSIIYIFDELIKLEYLKELNIEFNSINALDLRYNGNEDICVKNQKILRVY